MGRQPKSGIDRSEEQRLQRQLGEHLKELREAKNLTQRQLADKLNVTPQYIYMIESGRAKPSESRLKELARALGDLADEFLATAVGHVEEQFATRLKDAGLSPMEIDEAARRVSDRVKEDVVSGKEPLRVSRSLADDQQMLDALENNEDIVEIRVEEGPGTFGSSSASAYAQSVRDQFEPPKSQSASAPSRPRGPPSGQVVKAGPYARIVVDRSLTRAERRALQDIGRVIEHLLNK